KDVPLGKDLDKARLKWAELEAKDKPADLTTMKGIFDRYVRDVIPKKGERTQKDNLAELKQLRPMFDEAPIDSITPASIAGYRDARTAKVRANREIALLSHVFNIAREWGLTERENPCQGVRKNKETPRDYYADEAVWNSVRACADVDLQDAMDLAYLSAQRPGDVLKFTVRDIVEDALAVKQGKTSKRLRIELTDKDTGRRTELGLLIDRIRARTVQSIWLLATPDGRQMTRGMLRLRFVEARKNAADAARAAGDTPFAKHLMDFQFRDLRPKGASDMENLGEASKLLGHSDSQITKTVYRRIGESVKPVK
ncbi:MAG: tyrosine-type recombinase/integrase, partial [Propionivibrio sp.]|nr:tyrosine-type recombinase/integrase [Propionivibrio sp.]